MPAPVVIPYCKFSGSKLVLYNRFEGGYSRSGRGLSADINFSDNHTKGFLSDNSKKKIRTSVQLWCDTLEAKCFISRYSKSWIQSQITFCTLTLPAPQVHSDKEVKRDMLNHFLISCKRKFFVVTFLWVAEKQKNGNIHFHILLDRFIEWREIRTIWNKILDGSGYIEQYRINQTFKHKDGFFFDEKLSKSWTYDKQYSAYQYGIATDWNDPNSTDIHALYKVKNIAAYITKYLCKSDSKLSIDGRLWAQSDTLSTLRPLSYCCDSTIDNYIDNLMHSKGSEVFKGDMYQVVKGFSLRHLRNASPALFNQLCDTYNYNYSIIYNSKN
jgi:hypothetical protein